jgi:hypothetical protein
VRGCGAAAGGLRLQRAGNASCGDDNGRLRSSICGGCATGAFGTVTGARHATTARRRRGRRRRRRRRKGKILALAAATAATTTRAHMTGAPQRRMRRRKRRRRRRRRRRTSIRYMRRTEAVAELGIGVPRV